jgi:hypothetical protein
MAGVYNSTVAGGRYVVVSANGQLGATATPPAADPRSSRTSNLDEEAQRQAAEIRDLQEQIAKLKTTDEAMQLALRKLQAQNELVTRR